jgi:hypothetical protein
VDALADEVDHSVAVEIDVDPPPEVQAERDAAREKPLPPRSPDTVVIPAPSWEEDAEGTAVIRKQ